MESDVLPPTKARNNDGDPASDISDDGDGWLLLRRPGWRREPKDQTLFSFAQTHEQALACLALLTRQLQASACAGEAGRGGPLRAVTHHQLEVRGKRFRRNLNEPISRKCYLRAAEGDFATMTTFR